MKEKKQDLKDRIDTVKKLQERINKLKIKYNTVKMDLEEKFKLVFEIKSISLILDRENSEISDLEIKKKVDNDLKILQEEINEMERKLKKDDETEYVYGESYSLDNILHSKTGFLEKSKNYTPSDEKNLDLEEPEYIPFFKPGDIIGLDDESEEIKDPTITNARNKSETIKNKRKFTSKKEQDLWDDWIQKGDEYLDKGKYSKAIDCFERAISIYSKSEEIWMKMGLAYYGIDNYEKSLECLNNVVKINPNNKKVLYNIGLAYEYLNEFQHARLNYEEFLNAFPNDIDALYNLGGIYFGLENYQLAYEYFEKVSKINPTFQDVDIYLKEIKRETIVDEIEISNEKKEDTKPITIYRGGIIKGGKYLYKVKVENKSESVITDLNVIVNSYPKDSLKLIGSRIRDINKVGINGMVSPTFEFKPTSDCVKGTIKATVTYNDYQDNLQTLKVEPHEIAMVCGLLQPRKISMGEFTRIVQELLDFERTGDEIKIPYNPKLIFEKLKVLLPDQNFEFVMKPEEKVIGDVFIGELKGFAEGKFSKKQVALTITITGNKNDSKCVGKIEGFCQDPAMLVPLINEMGESIDEKIDEPLDCTKIIRLVQEKDVKSVNIEELVAEFDWEPSHAEHVMDSLLTARITVVERKDAVKGMIYYFPGLMR